MIVFFITAVMKVIKFKQVIMKIHVQIYYVTFGYFTLICIMTEIMTSQTFSLLL